MNILIPSKGCSKKQCPKFEQSVEFGEKTQNKGYSGVQGHRGRYQSKARMRFPVSD